MEPNSEEVVPLSNIVKCKTTALGNGETINQMSATDMVAFDKTVRENLYVDIRLGHFDHLDGYHGDHSQPELRCVKRCDNNTVE